VPAAEPDRSVERFHGLDQEDSVELVMHLHRYQLASAFAAGRRVLDFGCGDGYGAALLASRARRVLGVDADADEIAAASRRYIAPDLQFQAGAVEDVEAFAPGKWDLVTCFEVIEHVAERDQERLVAALVRALAPGGVLVMSTPNAAVKERQYARFPEWRNPFHVRELQTAEFVSLIERHLPHVRAVAQCVEAVSLLSGGGASAAAVQDDRSWVTIVIASHEPVVLPEEIPQVCAPRDAMLLEEILWRERQASDCATSSREQLAGAQAALAAARASEAAALASLTSLRATAAAAQGENERLRHKVAALDAEAARLRSEIVRLRSDLEHVTGRLAFRASRALDRWPHAKGLLTWAARRVVERRR
jgi:SAM-dependent methyltransferase